MQFFRINLDLVKLGEPTNKKYEYVALMNGGESWEYILHTSVLLLN